MTDIRRTRLAVGVSQAELARAAGITRTALSLIENGRLRASVGTLQALERNLDPFHAPALLRCGKGPVEAAKLVREVAAKQGLEYALTLDVAAFSLTRYQTPAAAWAYVRPLNEWRDALRRNGFRRTRPGERADLVLLRAPDDVLKGAQVQGGFALVSTRRLQQDCARLGGRHSLDAAYLFLAHPEARTPGLRLDADAMLKVFEEVKGHAPRPVLRRSSSR